MGLLLVACPYRMNRSTGLPALSSMEGETFPAALSFLSTFQIAHFLSPLSRLILNLYIIYVHKLN